MTPQEREAVLRDRGLTDRVRWPRTRRERYLRESGWTSVGWAWFHGARPGRAFSFEAAWTVANAPDLAYGIPHRMLVEKQERAAEEFDVVMRALA